MVTAANMDDKHPLPDLLRGQERRVYGDSAYASQKKRIEGKAPQANDFINRRTRRNGVLDQALKAKNRDKSRIRSRVSMCLAWSSGCGALAKCAIAAWP